MSPPQMNEAHAHGNAKSGPSPLKINKDSHLIKKTSPSSSSSSSSMAVKPQQHRHPVIIYTHSPKIIHTHPRDFMALVQKLTGLSKAEDDGAAQQRQQQQRKTTTEKGDILEDLDVNHNNVKEENESSVITDENCSSNTTPTANTVGDGTSSCFVPPIFENHHPFLGNMAFFPANPNDFLYPNHSCYNFTDTLVYTPPRPPPPPPVRSSVSSSTMDEMGDF